MNRDGERRLIGAFLAYLGKTVNQPMGEMRWPEDNNRGGAEVDALVDFGAKTVALEHTSLDVTQDQREANARFTKYLVPLEQDKDIWDVLYEKGVRLILSIPYGCLRKGDDWNALSPTLKGWILNSDNWTGARGKERPVLTLPFLVRVWARKSSSPRLILCREDPEMDMEKSLEKALGHKKARLQDYRKSGVATVLLLEVNDIAHNGEAVLEEAFRCSSCGVDSHLDEVWMADTDIADCPRFRWLWHRETSWLQQARKKNVEQECLDRFLAVRFPGTEGLQKKPKEDHRDWIVKDKQGKVLLEIQVTVSDAEATGWLGRDDGNFQRAETGDEGELDRLKEAVEKKAQYSPDAKGRLVLLLDGWPMVHLSTLRKFREFSARWLKDTGLREIWFVSKTANLVFCLFP